jgi:hypothetical protein
LTTYGTRQESSESTLRGLSTRQVADSVHGAVGLRGLSLRSARYSV